MTDHDDIIDVDSDDMGEDLGYTEFDWDKLPQQDVAEHDRIIELTAADARSLNRDSLTDLQLWAVAQVLADDEDVDGYQAIVHQLVFNGREHPAIDYASIAGDLLMSAILGEVSINARDVLARLHDLCDPDDATPQVSEGLVLYAEGNIEQAMAAYQAVLDDFEDDLFVYLQVADHFALLGRFADAREVLDKADEIARTEKDDEMIVWINAARQDILAAEAADEEEDED